MFEKLARLLARWHTKLKNRHAIWHVGTIIGTLARKKEVDTLLARWHVHYAGTQARWYVEFVGTHGTRFKQTLGLLVDFIFCKL